MTVRDLIEYHHDVQYTTDVEDVADARGQLHCTADVARAVFGGKARLTLVSRKTHQRYTYQIASRKVELANPTIWFVGLLNGPNNDKDFAYLGMIRNLGGPPRMVTTARSCAGHDAPSAKAFNYLLDCLQRPELPASLEVWVEGRCCRCGRTLTVPTSIGLGFGPECATKIAGGYGWM